MKLPITPFTGIDYRVYRNTSIAGAPNIMPENMDISAGFQIEKPNVFVPWSTSSRELVTMFRDLDLKQVNNNYIVTRCVSLKGLSHKLGFHFDLRPGFGIRYFELFDNGCQGNELSFLTFQKHLEATFGEPTTVAPGEEGFPSYTWQRDGCVVLHRVQKRFGPTEIVRIERSSSTPESIQ